MSGLREVFFVVFAFLAIFGAFLTVSRRNPIYSALSLILFFGAISGVMMILSAPFLALMQLMVYAGAILVLFLFVIMLLSLRDEELGAERPWPLQLLAGVGAVVLFGLLAAAILQEPVHNADPVGDGFGSPEATGRAIFGPPERDKDDKTPELQDFGFVLPFEVVSVLILAATMGAVVLAKKHLEKPAAPEAPAQPEGHH